MILNHLKKIGFIVSFSFVLGFVSCHSSQELMEPKASAKTKKQKPQFIDDIAFQGSSTKIKVTTLQSVHKKAINPSVANVLQLKYAEMLQVMPEAICNFSLYGFIEDWYGVRYRMGGNDKSGIDCSAFVQRLYENVFCTNLVRTALEQFHMCRFVLSQDSLEEGDLVFFHTRGKKRVTHVGIYLMNNFFVHASSSQGVMISSLNEDYWSRYYAGAGKVLKENNL